MIKTKDIDPNRIKKRDNKIGRLRSELVLPYIGTNNGITINQNEFMKRVYIPRLEFLSIRCRICWICIDIYYLSRSRIYKLIYAQKNITENHISRITIDVSSGMED